MTLRHDTDIISSKVNKSQLSDRIDRKISEWMCTDLDKLHDSVDVQQIVVFEDVSLRVRFDEDRSLSGHDGFWTDQSIVSISVSIMENRDALWEKPLVTRNASWGLRYNLLWDNTDIMNIPVLYNSCRSLRGHPYVYKIDHHSSVEYLVTWTMGNVHCAGW